MHFSLPSKIPSQSANCHQGLTNQCNAGPRAFLSCLTLTHVLSSSGKKVVDVAVGSTHCLALTDDGEVHSWGSNDKMQHFDTLFSNKKQPKALPGLNSKHIVGISCGPGQV